MGSNIILEMPAEMAHAIAGWLKISLAEAEASASVKDRETGRSHGFGFVEMTSREEAQAAFNEFHGKDNRQLSDESEQEIINQIAVSGLKLRQSNQATERAWQEIERLAAATQTTLTRLEEKFGC